MLETISGNIMIAQGYIQCQKANLKVTFMRKRGNSRAWLLKYLC